MHEKYTAIVKRQEYIEHFHLCDIEKRRYYDVKHTPLLIAGVAKRRFILRVSSSYRYPSSMERARQSRRSLTYLTRSCQEYLMYRIHCYMRVCTRTRSMCHTRETFVSVAASCCDSRTESKRNSSSLFLPLLFSPKTC